MRFASRWIKDSKVHHVWSMTVLLRDLPVSYDDTDLTLLAALCQYASELGSGGSFHTFYYTLFIPNTYVIMYCIVLNIFACSIYLRTYMHMYLYSCKHMYTLLNSFLFWKNPTHFVMRVWHDRRATSFLKWVLTFGPVMCKPFFFSCGWSLPGRSTRKISPSTLFYDMIIKLISSQIHLRWIIVNESQTNANFFAVIVDIGNILNISKTNIRSSINNPNLPNYLTLIKTLKMRRHLYNYSTFSWVVCICPSPHRFNWIFLSL